VDCRRRLSLGDTQRGALFPGLSFLSCTPSNANSRHTNIEGSALKFRGRPSRTTPPLFRNRERGPLNHPAVCEGSEFSTRNRICHFRFRESALRNRLPLLYYGTWPPFEKDGLLWTQRTFYPNQTVDIQNRELSHLSRRLAFAKRRPHPNWRPFWKTRRALE
jgi:hypothetical protein